MSFNPKRRYSAIVVLSEDLERVVLIHKLKPDWQAGKANLPGGKVEIDDYWHYPACMDGPKPFSKGDVTKQYPNRGTCCGDEPAQYNAHQRCAVRELREETGLDIAATALHLFCRLRFRSREGDDAECCFYAVRGNVDAARTMEAERVFVGEVCEVLSGRTFYSAIVDGKRSSLWLPTMPNLPCLVAMARQCLRGEGAGSWPLTIYEAGAGR